MSYYSNAIGGVLIALTISGHIFASPAQAVPLVTYNWTTASEGFGSHVSEPSSASFQVPLSDVLNGAIPQSDISNIQLVYPGLMFNSAVTSTVGNDFSAFVDRTTGAFIFHDVGQGLAVIAFAGTNIFNISTFLSITVDNPSQSVTGERPPETTVATPPTLACGLRGRRNQDQRPRPLGDRQGVPVRFTGPAARARLDKC